MTQPIEAQIKSDMIAAMKAADKQQANALRLILSELQKSAKDGGDDELAVLRRERKRRVESATAFRDGGRSELAVEEEYEAELIAKYLPAEIDDAELEKIVAEKVAEAGASSPQDMGAVMKLVMPATGGRADGKRVSDAVKKALVG